ncbi:MAG: hypothetical protein ACRDQW_01525 [Haloechinothrix sp.]
MTSSTEERSGQENPGQQNPGQPNPGQLDGTEARLRQLIDRGYQFIHPTDAFGGVVAVVGVRVHNNVVDVVQLNAEDDVIATRMPGDEADILAPSTVLWRLTGGVEHVLDAMLALPDDHTPGAKGAGDRAAVTGCWVPTRTSASTWVPAQV